jgi:hypothetical protein
VTQTDTDPTSQIRDAMRLGWAVAEVRGRLRIGDDSRLATQRMPAHSGPALPLSIERSPAELRTEAQSVLSTLAAQWSTTYSVSWLALRMRPTSAQDDGLPPAAEGEETAAYVCRLGDSLRDARARKDDPAAQHCWDVLAEVFYKWDASIQDTFASQPFGTSSAYQLARGLAETFWALDPNAKPHAADSWCFLLGPDRRKRLESLINRLSPWMHAYTADALKGSLAQWSRIPCNGRRQPTDADLAALLRQIMVWRDLLLTGGDPMNLLEPKKGVAEARRVLPVVRGFIPELVLLAAAIIVLGLTAYLFAQRDSGVGTVTAVLAGLGITGAGILAWVKSTAQDVTAQIRRAMYGNMVVDAATLLPSTRKALRHPHR